MRPLFRRVAAILRRQLLAGGAAWVLATAAAAESNSIPTFSRLVDFQKFADTNSGSSRVKVRGTVTYQHQGRTLFIQDQTAAVYAYTRFVQPMNVGDEVEVFGDASGPGTTFSPTLYSCAFTRIGPGKLPTPRAIRAPNAMSGDGDMELVQISGKLVNRHQRDNTVVLTLLSESISFRVELLHEQPTNPFPNLQLNSVVQVTGICSVKSDTPPIVRTFELLMRTPEDLTVLKGPSWWTRRRLVALVLCVAVFSAFALMWVLQLRAQVERRTAEVRNLNRDLERRVEERTRELYLANERLAATNRELEAFSYSVSHDLKAPLRAISGFTRVLAEGYSPQFDDNGKQLLERVEANASKMGRLIDDLLIFSRAAHSQMRASVLDMEDIFRQALEEIVTAHPARKIEFLIHPLPRAYGDLALIKQVVINLLSNAVKFCKLRTTTVIEVGCDAGSDLIYFVKDNGVGFDPDHVGKIFGIFQRLHGREYEGTGVGLAIVQRIVTRHGGNVSAEGKTNEGAVFKFSLPRPPANQPLLPTPPAKIPVPQ